MTFSMIMIQASHTDYGGAIRECAMLHCNNASHKYHTVPDIYSNQNLPDVKSDSIKIMKKIFSVLAETYDVPEWFTNKYNAKNE